MKKSWGLPIMLMAILVMGSSSGCLGLLQMRETMEDLREPPETKVEVTKTNHGKVFENSLLEGFEEYSTTTSIEIGETVSEMTIYKKVKISGSETIGCQENITRYVRAELRTPDYVEGDEPIWSMDECVDVDSNTDQIVPASTFQTGTWTLIIKARGLGSQNALLQDYFILDLTIKRTCIEYPLENVCT